MAESRDNGDGARKSWLQRFREKHAKPKAPDIEAGLWATGYSSACDEKSSELLMQQYLKYLDMADKISDRRATANTFFLTLNTGILTASAAFGKESLLHSPFIGFALAALITLCLAWIFLIRSYRTLNTAKFKVAGMLEKRLPASPVWSAEWQALKEGKSWVIHIPLTPIETLVPVVFILPYVAIGYLAWTTGSEAAPRIFF